MTLAVSDHAVLRYIERKLGVDVEAARAQIAASAGEALKAGRWTAIEIDGVTFCLGRLPSGAPIVATTLGPGMRAKRRDRRQPAHYARF